MYATLVTSGSLGRLEITSCTMWRLEFYGETVRSIEAIMRPIAQTNVAFIVLLSDTNVLVYTAFRI